MLIVTAARFRALVAAIFTVLAPAPVVMLRLPVSVTLVPVRAKVSLSVVPV